MSTSNLPEHQQAFLRRLDADMARDRGALDLSHMTSAAIAAGSIDDSRAMLGLPPLGTPESTRRGDAR